MTPGEFITRYAKEGVLPWNLQREAMDRYGISCRVMDSEIFTHGYYPERYSRHRDILKPEDHLKLIRTRVAIIGCGALGGFLALYLGRLGVGALKLIDHDVFVPSNLNRQPLSHLNSLGRYKVDVTQEELALINPAVQVSVLRERFTLQNAGQCLEDVDLAADGLDDRPDRLDLETACEKLGRPFIHGAVAHLNGQVARVLPGEGFLHSIWGEAPPKATKPVCNFSFMPGIIAGLQTRLILGVICGAEWARCHGAWFLDAFDFTVEPL